MSKLSVIQMTSTENVPENLRVVENLMQEAAHQGASVAILPEMFPIMCHDKNRKLHLSETYGHGPIQDFLATLAKKHHLYIVGGTIPIKTDDPTKSKAATLVFNHHGQIVARYDKMHLFDVIISDTESYLESETIMPGDALTLVDTPCGKLALTVCYDIRFPELYRALFNQGAEIFAIPAAFTVKTGTAHWEVLARSRAIENFCYVAGAAQVGTHYQDRETYGHSLIVNPWGEIISSLTHEVGVITAEINLNLLHTIRKNIPIEMHQKIFIDTSQFKS